MALILEQRVSLKPFNSFGVDARASWFSRVQSVADLQRLQDDARLRHLPRLILGAGSNVLFVGDFDGLVIQAALPGIEPGGRTDDAELLRVGAGQSWPELVEQLVRSGHPGLENLALIPGWTGAAPIQNIGAYGLELSERLHSVRVWEASSGACRDMWPEQCALGYRDSIFKRDEDGQRIIVSITLRLPLHWEPITGYTELERELALRGCTRPTALDIYEAVCALRRRKLPDPAKLGNAGSFFKNPVVERARHAELLERHPSMVSYALAGGRYKIAAGWLIEACQLRGVRRGRVGTYERQALVLVNQDGASGAEVLALAHEVQERVHEKFEIYLEPEVRIVGA
ncbi:MAG TPA: UDP-N-acetylmuramate dehydrogenase [Burkholderiaceae bacterium]|nr:UDP-N-acetylmuramate dehydrogenase [Burkholderiaceae bacterium]